MAVTPAEPPRTPKPWPPLQPPMEMSPATSSRAPYTSSTMPPTSPVRLVVRAAMQLPPPPYVEPLPAGRFTIRRSPPIATDSELLSALVVALFWTSLAGAYTKEPP